MDRQILTPGGTEVTEEELRSALQNSLTDVGSLGSFEFSTVVPRFLLPYSLIKVRPRTETLEVGSQAPDFSLEAANREGSFRLANLHAGGPLILEFLRGTW